jgi:rubredoxin
MKPPPATPAKPAGCETCGYETEALVFLQGQGRADGTRDEVPWTLDSHWLCRLCAVAAYEVHRRQIEPGIVRMLNVMLEALERRDGKA